ncbi:MULTISPECIES: hypothetical protein [Rhodococcus]|uniref:hypothetical protein n=1 Tax=Rhodococcus TaxID=1827 RepID=UPI000C7AFD41|nr:MULTISPECIES: hypothetical protein [Rhodococcus]AUM16444.1 hypothetical protein CSW53_07850 [Rhodococcus ruber]
MTTVGEAKLKLSADGSSLPAEVRAAVAAAMRGINETLKVEVDADVTPFESKMATVLRPREVDVDVDVNRTAFDSFLRDMDRADKDFVVRVALLGDTNVGDRFSDQTIGVRLDIQNAGAFNTQMATLTRPRQVDISMNVDQSQLGALAAVQNRTVDIRANLTNAGQVEAQLAYLTRPRSVNIGVNVNHSQLQMLTQMLNSLTNLGGSLGGGALSSVGSMLGGIVSAATSAVGAIAMVTTAASAAAVAAGAIPIALTGALGAVSAAAGAMAAGVTGGMAAVMASLSVMWNPDLKAKMDSAFEGIKGHMKEIANRLAPAMTRMFDALHPAFDRLAPSLERITDGVSGLIDHLTVKLPEIADQLGPALEKAFQAGVPHLKNLIDNLPRLTEAFGNFMSKFGDPAVVEAANRVWQKLPGILESIGEAIPAVAQGFSDLMGWIDAGNLDPFIQGFKDLWAELSSADWSGTIDSIANLANTWGEFMSSIDGQSVADGITAVATAFDAVLNAGMAVKNTLDGIWDVISPKNVMGEMREMAHAILGMLKDTFGNLPFIGDDISKAIDGALQKLGPVKFKATPELDKVGVEKLESMPGPKIKVDVEPQWHGLTTNKPPKVKVDIETDNRKIPVEVDVKPFKLDIPPKAKVMVDVEATPFKLDIPPKTKVMVDVEQTAGFKLDVPPKVKVMVEPDGSGFFNFAPPQPPPVKVKVLADTAGLSADIDSKTKVMKTVTIPIAYGPLPAAPPIPTPPTVPVPLQFQVPPMPAIPSPPPVQVQVHTNADEVAGKINSIPGSKVTTHTVSSNVGAVIGQIASMQSGTSSFHSVSSNAGAVAAQISSLNGRNTSSTHTIRVVETGSGKRMEDGGFNFRSYAAGGITALEKYANGKLPSAATIMRPRRRLIQWAEPSTKGEAFIPLARSKRARSLDIWEQTGQMLGAWDQVYASMAARAAGAPSLAPYAMAAAGLGNAGGVGTNRTEVHAPITIQAAPQPATTGWAVQSALTSRLRG